MSVIDDQLRFPQNGSMVTHDQILAELIKQLDAKTVTGKAIADLLNIAPARITEMKKGARRIQPDEMAVLAKFFSMGQTESANNNTHIVWVPVIGMAAAGSWREAITFPSYVVPHHRMPGCNQAFAVEVHGDSMDLLLPERSWAVIDPDQRRLIERKVYLISNGDGDTTIKRYRENPSRFEPVSRNSEHQPIFAGESEIRIIGRVVSFSSDEGL